MAIRQNSTNGKPKSPRIQVVLPEALCEELTALANEESRTVSNMAKVLIQRGIKAHFNKERFVSSPKLDTDTDTDTFRNKLENQSIKRLKGMPKRIKYYKQSDN